MDEINKDFDGVSWEWKGRTAIRDLKPICPECQYELDIEMSDIKIEGYDELTKDGDSSLKITGVPVSYFCSKCNFTTPTSINGIDEPKDLRKAVLKEFEHRQRLMVRKTSKNNK